MRRAIILVAALAISVPAVAQSVQTAGELSSNASVALDVSGMGTASIAVAGTFSGTLNFEVAGVGGTPVAVDCGTPSNPGAAVNSTTSPGVWTCPVAGLKSIQVRMSSYVSGTAQVFLSASAGGGGSGGGTTTGTIELVDGDNDPLTDDPNNALKVSVVSGSAAGTTDTDDGSVAAGQATLGLNIGLNQYYNGTAWVRMLGNATDGLLVNLGANNDVTVTGTVTANAGTNLNTSALLTTTAHDAAFGSAGTADTQVRTIQGIASMTPVVVSATDLDVQSGGADILSTTAFNSAFGTAGSADSQVLSVQGIASGVALGIDSELPAAAAAADNMANPTAPFVLAASMCWDGATWDRCSGSSSDTELPAAAALADNTANPTVPGVAAFLMVYDGTTWDRAQVATDMTVGSAFGTTAPGQLAVYSDFDGSALPTATNVDTEGEAVPIAASIKGVQYMMLVSEDGALQYGTSTTPLVVGDGSGAMNVVIDSGSISCSNCSGSGASDVEGSTYTLGTDSVAPLGAYFDDTSPTAATEDRIHLVRMTSARALHVSVRDALPAGTNNIGDVDILSIAAGNNNIGDVDVATIAAGNNNIGDVDVASIAAGDNDIGNVDLEFAGTAAATGNGTTNAQTMRVTLSSDSTGTVAATQSGTWTVQPGNTANTTAWLTKTADPCSGAKTYIPINISTATTTELTAALAGASTHYYVCSLNLVTAAANNVALVDDDTDNCASVTSGLAGGTTAASGWNFAANGGAAFGNGEAAVFKTNGTNRVLCLVTSAATQLSGTMSVVAAQ